MRGLILALSLAAGLSVQATASAAVMVGRVTGYVQTGTEQIGFGSPQTQALDGKPMSLVWWVDTSISPGAAGPQTETVYGGITQAENGVVPPGPIRKTQFTVNAQTYIGGASDWFGLEWTGPNQIGMIADDATYETIEALGGRRYDLSLDAITDGPARISTPYVWDGRGGSYGKFEILFLQTDPLRTRSIGGYFTITSFSLQAAVPEPATWALMIVGFGMTGAGIRQQRKAAGSPER